MPVRTTLLILLAILCWNCAQQGSPTGGPRDEDPPVVVECEPANYSTQFSAKKIAITFDEYVVLDNVNQELIVSPPMEEKPEVKLRKKTIVIEFEEELKDSTTYTFNFGSAIKDLHEGNKLLNYEYVFSTGDVLDSLSVRGILKYALDLTVPKDPFTIMLYTDLADSVPLIDIPLYVGKSDDSGVFSVNNLRPDIYKVFALKDGNNNLLFDLPTEEIAFLDTSLTVNAEFARSLLEILPDSLAIGLDSIVASTDSTLVVTDSTLVVVIDSTLLVTDSTLVALSDSALAATDSTGVSGDSLEVEGPDLNSIYIDMMLFTEEVEIQYITDYNRDDRRKMQLAFASPLTDTFQYRALNVNEEDPLEMLEYFTSDRDSLTLWVLDSTHFMQDTLLLEINYTMKDTAMQYFTKTDTLLFSYREPRPTKKKAEEENEEAEEKLAITTIRANGDLNLNRNLALDLDFPLKEFNDSLIRFYHIPDTTEIPQAFKTSVDSSLLTRGWISTDWESASKYKLVLLPGALSSVYALAHDTIEVPFKTRDIEYYGTILLTLQRVEHRVIVQLINKEKILRQMNVDESGLLTFSYLPPQEYQVKVIHDLNMNGKWDTGNYMEKLQPEPVEFLRTNITVRSNWDHDVIMSLLK